MAKRITKIELATASREADNTVERVGLENWLELHQVDFAGLHYVADQRALRAAALLIDGMVPEQLKRGGFQVIHLSPKALSLMPVLLACVVDGFALGLTVRGEEQEGTEVRS